MVLTVNDATPIGELIILKCRLSLVPLLAFNFRVFTGLAKRFFNGFAPFLAFRPLIFLYFWESIDKSSVTLISPVLIGVNAPIGELVFLEYTDASISKVSWLFIYKFT